MASVTQSAGLTGTNATVPFDALQSHLAGQVITPESSSYDEARKTIFLNVDRRPLAIVKAADAHDVATTIRFARERSLPLAVRSGGHSIAYHSVIEGAIVLDLSSMKQVSIDPVQRIARVQAGATSGDLAGPAHEHGLALSTGDTHSVAMGGLVTGGGIGFMVRKSGLAIDNVLAAEVVTANGEIVTASEDEHPDLFWAIRGGGGNFGVVTEFTVRLAPAGQILGGMLVLPASREILRGYLDIAAAAPDDLTTIANLMHAPPEPFMPQEWIGKLVLAILVCWTGSLDDGERALAPLRALATPVIDAVRPMPYPEIYHFTEQQAAPQVIALRSMFAHSLSDATLDATLAAMERATSPFSLVQFRVLGGAVERVPADATAFAHRHQPYLLMVLGLWLDPTEDGAKHAAWTETLWQTVRQEGSGVYVNFVQDEGADRVRDAYPPATYERLAAIKRQYDPDNVFRFNQNIPPKQ